MHIMQGFVNHLFWNSLVPLLGREKAMLWPEKLNIVSKGYHGEIFEGNQCRKLLKNADKLLDHEIFGNIGYFCLVPYASAFKIMDQIVSDCFSNKLKTNKDSLRKKIDELKLNLRAINVTDSLKIHVLLSHLVDCLDYLHSYGLSVWSKQAGESIHREFLKYWERYKINLITAKEFAQKLLQTVIEFSSRHI